MNEIDIKLFDHQKYTGWLESGTIEIYHLSRKGYLRVFDKLSVGGAVKGLYSHKYTSRLRKEIMQFVKSRYYHPEPTAPPIPLNWVDNDGVQYINDLRPYIGGHQ